MGNSGLVDRIRELTLSLPESDVKFARKFLDSRDFESLKFLVDSSLIRVKRGLNREIPKEEYLKADLEGMEKLKSEVDAYWEALELPKQEDGYNDFNGGRYSY